MFKGIGMRATDLTSDARVPVPFCLVPSPFPKTWFDKARDLQPYLNYVLHSVSYCPDFLKECLSRYLNFAKRYGIILYIVDMLIISNSMCIIWISHWKTNFN